MQWRIIRGNLPWLLNRDPCSTHVRLLEQAVFEPVRILAIRAVSEIDRRSLAGGIAVYQKMI